MNLDDPYLLTKCAKNFLMLPHPYRNELEAKKLLDKALLIAPDDYMVLHVMARYYEKKKVPVSRKSFHDLSIFIFLM